MHTVQASQAFLSLEFLSGGGGMKVKQNMGGQSYLCACMQKKNWNDHAHFCLTTPFHAYIIM